MRQIAKRATTPLALIELPDERPYDRQPKERGHEEFRIYLGLGPTRDLKKTAEITGRPFGTIQSWSGRYAWQARAAVWDADRTDELATQVKSRQMVTVVKQADTMEAVYDRLVSEIDRLDLSELPPDKAIDRLLSVAREIRRTLGIEGTGNGAAAAAQTPVTMTQVNVYAGELDRWADSVERAIALEFNLNPADVGAVIAAAISPTTVNVVQGQAL